MSEQKIDFQLSMVSTPADPTKSPARSPAAKPQSSGMIGRICARIALFAAIGLMSAACYLAISRYILESVQVVGESMVPTLQQNSHYILNRWAFHNAKPQRGDVVVILDPGDHGFSVKRIVAVEGESVHFRNGRVYVGGEELKEPYLLPNTLTFTYTKAKEQFITCGKDQYFVLGDNRLASIDSRAYGPVPGVNILGKVVLQ